MFRIQKTVRFEAAHQLSHFPETHKCHRLHGHNYIVEVELTARDLDDMGVVTDFGAVSDLIRQRYDHQNLNDFEEFSNNPTAEKIASAIVDLIDNEILTKLNMNVPPPGWVRVMRVRVHETQDSWAEWTPDKE